MHECSYRGCHDEATHIVNYGRSDHPLCTHHARKEHHPKDLHDRIRPALTTETDA